MSEVFPGYSPAEISADALRQELLIRTLLLGVRTAMPVKVIAVHPGTGTPPSIGTVDVQPLVQTVDGTGKLWSLGEVYGAQFLRLQAGSNAVVIDPQVGDIGLAVVCDRDISSVIAANGALSGPGSARTHHLSDMIYVASIISIAAITQYLMFSSSGISVVSQQAVTLQAPQINLDGAVSQTNGDVTMQTKLTVPNVDATTDVTVPNGSVNNHVHIYSPGSGTPTDTGAMTG
jgi:adhesin HecA-like repeat protein